MAIPDCDTLIGTWMVGQQACSPVVKTMGGLLVRVCTISCDAQLALVEEMPAAAAQVAASIANSLAVVAGVAKQRTVKISKVLKQGK